jgi:hypothetical protein
MTQHKYRGRSGTFCSTDGTEAGRAARKAASASSERACMLRSSGSRIGRIPRMACRMGSIAAATAAHTNIHSLNTNALTEPNDCRTAPARTACCTAVELASEFSKGWRLMPCLQAARCCTWLQCCFARAGVCWRHQRIGHSCCGAFEEVNGCVQRLPLQLQLNARVGRALLQRCI